MSGINGEILLEGSYLYFQNGANFSQENFKFVKLLNEQEYHVYAEILSRIETGEFLKLLVRYEMTDKFHPTLVKIEKSIGSKYAEELYRIDSTTQELHYTFTTSEGVQEFKKPHTAKHYLVSPAFSTSALFTLTRKFDAAGRTPVILVSSSNKWSYEGPPTEKLIYAEFKSRELADFRVNNTSLSASHLCLYEHDASHAGGEEPVQLFVSKHYAIPYQMIHGDQKIVIKHLKKNN